MALGLGTLRLSIGAKDRLSSKVKFRLDYNTPYRRRPACSPLNAGGDCVHPGGEGHSAPKPKVVGGGHNFSGDALTADKDDDDKATVKGGRSRSKRCLDDLGDPGAPKRIRTTEARHLQVR